MSLVASPPAVCTMAMDFLKTSKVNDIVVPVSTVEQLCARNYDESRRICSCTVDFSFARSRKVIPRNVTYELVFGSGDYSVYELPYDFLGLRYINDEAIPLADVDFDIEENRLLLPTSDSSVNIGYVKDITDPTRFPSHFKRFLAADIAYMTAIAITGKLEFINAMSSIRENALIAAQNIELRSRPNKVVTYSKLAGARRARAGEIGAINTGRARLK